MVRSGPEREYRRRQASLTAADGGRDKSVNARVPLLRPDPKPTGPFSVDPTEKAKGDAAEKIEQAQSRIALRAEIEELGAYYDEPTHKLVVVAAAGHNPQAVHAKLGGRTDTVVVQGQASRADIDAAQKELVDWFNGLGSNKPTMVLTVNPQAQGLVVETDADPDKVAAITNKYGKSVVIKSTPRAAFSRNFSRQDDWPSPHWGGSRITIPALGQGCTTGFTIVNSANDRFLVTAAHCGNIGNDTVNAGQSLGVITYRSDFPNRDFALIHNSPVYAGSIYVNCSNCDDRGNVTSAGDPSPSSVQYCHSGSYSGETCNHQVTALDATACDTSGCTNGLVQATNGFSTQGGDSGGAVFLRVGSGNSDIRIRGSIVGAGPTNGNLYFHAWSTISAFWGVNIVPS